MYIMDKINEKNFLIITGGAGFIGTNLIKKLALETLL